MFFSEFCKVFKNTFSYKKSQVEKLQVLFLKKVKGYVWQVPKCSFSHKSNPIHVFLLNFITKICSKSLLDFQCFYRSSLQREQFALAYKLHSLNKICSVLILDNITLVMKQCIIELINHIKYPNKGWYTYDIHFEEGWGIQAKMRCYWT